MSWGRQRCPLSGSSHCPTYLLSPTSSHLPSHFSVASGQISRMRHYVQMNKVITMTTTKLSHENTSAVSTSGNIPCVSLGSP